MELKKGMRSDNNALLLLIKDLPNDLIMAEIGCYAGESTLMFLKSGKVKQLFAIDPWPLKLKGEIKGTKEFIERINYVYSNMSWAEKSFDIRVSPFLNVVKLKMTFDEAFNSLPKLDFIYIDGDHRYKAIINDIGLAKRIIKAGGIIAGHDYTEESHDVIRAVNESFGKIDKIYADSSWVKQV